MTWECRVWEEGQDRAERILLREREDAERARLSDLDAADPLPGPSRLLQWTRAVMAYRETLDMATKARGRKPKAEAQAAKLLTALDFVKVANRDTEQGKFQQHVALVNKWAIASDGVLSAGHPIDEDLSCCPHTEQLTAALRKINGALSITQGDNGRLTLAGAKLKAQVPCLDIELMQAVHPDPMQWPLAEAVKAAMMVAAMYTKEGGTTVTENACFIGNGSCIGTNGKCLVEAWHGVGMPELVVPRVFVIAVGKQEKSLEGFGFSDRSLTFYFEGGAWIRTQLYAEGYPADGIRRVLSEPTQPVVIPEDFFPGVDAVSPFHEDGIVYMRDSVIQSGREADLASSYECKGLVTAHGQAFKAQQITAVAQFATQFDINTKDDRMYWFGETTRGIIMGIRQ